MLKCVVLMMLALGMARGGELPDAEVGRIGHKVWANECGGTVGGLTSWNAGEEFASLGIGHFIWYPAGMRGPFEESFPELTGYLAGHGVTVPGWMRGACPWRTRGEFLNAQGSDRMKELRGLLADTVGLQGRFLVQRMRAALPKMVAAAGADEGERVRRNFERLEGTGDGTFELIDYVNFKGEGTLATERYKGEGWGLLQVLEGMPGDGDAVQEFAKSAKAVLARRVRNAPAERHEERWLAGWNARVERYMEY